MSNVIQFPHTVFVHSLPNKEYRHYLDVLRARPLANIPIEQLKERISYLNKQTKDTAPMVGDSLKAAMVKSLERKKKQAELVKQMNENNKRSYRLKNK